LADSSGKQTSFVAAAPCLEGRTRRQRGLAIAMLRHQRRVRIFEDAIAKGLVTVRWPARLQRLSPGPLTGSREVWLDGGHNPNAGSDAQLPEPHICIGQRGCTSSSA
jgi:dihydrofolate synthase / folylpolyglutamate synthase